MKIVYLTLLLMSILLPGFAIAEDFQVKWGLNEYDSKTGIFTQRYCAEGKSPQSVTLKLSAKVIKALLDAAREDAKSSKGSEDKRCFSSGAGAPLLTIFAEKEKKLLI